MIVIFPSLQEQLIIVASSITMKRLVLYHLLTLTSTSLCSFVFGRVNFKSTEDRAMQEEYLIKTVNETREFLEVPPILLYPDKSSPREFVDNENRGQWSRVSLGIVIENYSNFKFTKPLTSKTTNCGRVREVFPGFIICHGLVFRLFLRNR